MTCLVHVAFIDISTDTVNVHVAIQNAVTCILIKSNPAALPTGGAWVRCTNVYLDVTHFAGVAVFTHAQNPAKQVDALSVHAHGVFTLVDVALTPVSGEARYAGARSHSLRARAVSTRWAGTC